MAHKPFQIVSLDNFHRALSKTTELSSVALGGEVIAVSDEFFAEAFHLLLVEPAPSLKGLFGPKGALYSGWESRRHNPAHDWCIIRLGTTGTIVGFDVDTTHFNGNEAPEVSIDALLTSPSEKPGPDDSRWSELLPRVPLGPSSRHLFEIPETSRISHVKLNMYPDGGIARFRVYGHVSPVWPEDVLEPFDIAHVFAGGQVVFTSDQHFGVGSNLILPGRGKDMGDGWETKRSRAKGHKDWAIIKLGTPGTLVSAEIDTAHFKGNFPESCELHGVRSLEDIPLETDRWVEILSRTKLGPHRRHFFDLQNVNGESYTHVRMTIYPDGGVKRVRIIGTRGDPAMSNSRAALNPLSNMPAGILSDITLTPAKQSPPTTGATIVPVLPLTPEAFAPFGKVIQAYGDHDAAPRGTKISPANGGTASKFHKLALVETSYPPDANATAGLSVYRCTPLADKEYLYGGRYVTLNVLERHPYTNQAFIPMSGGGLDGDEALKDFGSAYLVVVARNGADGSPDLTSLRAFIASGGQGIVYGTAVWHQPMTVLRKPMDLTCIETQIGDGSQADCEILELKATDGQILLKLPEGV